MTAKAFFLREEGRGYIGVYSNGKRLGAFPLLDTLGSDLYNVTQTGFYLLREDGSEAHVEIPSGSLLIVKRSFGADAVIYAYQAWPVLVSGRLPGDDVLHKFKEPW